MRIRLQLILFVSVLFVSSTLQAQWTQTSGPQGGEVSQFLRVTGPQKSLVLAASVNGVFYSTDDGKSWSTSGLQGIRINHLMQAIGDLSIGQVVYALSDSIVYRSSDGGEDWERSFGADTLQVLSLVQNGSSLFLSVVANAGHTGSGIYSTRDNGTTWLNLRTIADVIGIHDLVSTTDHVLGIGDSNVVWSSNGAALTWAKVNFPSHYQAYRLLTSGNTVIAGVNGGIVLSTDQGANWVAPANGSLDSFDVVTQLAVNGLSMLAIAQNKSYRSFDGGRQWQEQVFAPFSASSGYTALDYVGTVYLASTRGGIFRATNPSTWTAANNGFVASDVLNLATSGSTLFAQTYLGIARSTDQGLTWISPVDSSGLADRSIARLDTIGGHLYAEGDGFFEWTGSDWSGLSTTPVHSVISDGPVLLAVDLNSSIIRSFDAGATWQRANDGLPADSVVSNFLVRSGSNIIDIIEMRNAATGNKTLFYASGDHGSSWFATDSLAELIDPSSFVDMPFGTFVSYAGSDTVLVSTDAGLHWSRRQVAPSGVVNNITQFRNSIVASVSSARFPDNGVYFSGNGVTWKNRSAGLDSNLGAHSLVQDGQYAYLGTTTSGVWRMDAGALGVARSASVQTTVPMEVYPNPAVLRSSVKFSIRQSGHVTLKLINVEGETLETLVDREMNAGSVEIPVDCSRLASSTYQVVLTLPDGEAKVKLSVKH